MTKNNKERLTDIGVGLGISAAIVIFFYIFIVLWTNP